VGRLGNNGEWEAVISDRLEKGQIMPFPALFGISMAFGLAVWGALAWRYIWPALKERPRPENLKPILLVWSNSLCNERSRP